MLAFIDGHREVWRRLRRQGWQVARCTVARLMRALGLQGVVRGRRAQTTVPAPAGDRPGDRVRRDFDAPRPNALWVAGPTCVATWRGFAYVAFVIDAFARRLKGRRVPHTLRTDLPLAPVPRPSLGRRSRDQAEHAHVDNAPT